MTRLINIVVASTKRKRGRVSAPLCFRDLVDVSFSRRFREWTTRLEETSGSRLSAASLYAGDHWQIARELTQHATASGWAAQLWICSPGYGLVRPEALLHPYSANYSERHADSILTGCELNRVSALRQWWKSLSRWTGPETGQPRSVEALAQSYVNVPILVVVSKAVIDVLEPDLLADIKQLGQNTELLVVSGGSVATGPLGTHILPCDARLQSALGGARMSLNVRTARFLLETCPDETLSRSWAQRLSDRLSRTAPVVRYERVALTDDEVTSFILRGLRSNPSVSWSGLLRLLRDSGYRCEQKRFAGIFRHVISAQGS